MPRNLAHARPLSDAEVAKFKAHIDACIGRLPPWMPKPLDKRARQFRADMELLRFARVMQERRTSV